MRAASAAGIHDERNGPTIRRAGACACLVVSLLIPSPSTAALERAATSGAAVSAAGTAFRLTATLGESGPVGIATGGGRALVLGFWRPAPGAFSLADAERSVPAPLARLLSLAPNPFPESMRIAFELGAPARVRLSVFDIAGRRVARVLDAPFERGRHVRFWDGRTRSGLAVASGVYHVRFQAGGRVDVRRIVRIR